MATLCRFLFRLEKMGFNSPAFFEPGLVRVFLENENQKKGYKPTARRTAPTRMPIMDVEADSIPSRMYPTATPTFNGV